MVEVEEVPCEYCGSVIQLSKAMKINMKTGEYKYACTNCAKKWSKD